MAKKKESKVSITSVDKILKAARRDPVEKQIQIGDEVLTFEVKPFVSIDEFAAMVRAAVDAVFIVNEDTGFEEYHPEYEEAARFDAIIQIVANFKGEMSIDRVFDLLYCTDLEKEIMGVWSSSQLSRFISAVNEGIVAKLNGIHSTERTKLIEMSNQMDDAIESFQKIVETFAGMDADVMQKAIEAMAGMSEAGLAKAVVEARGDDFVEQRRAELSVVK